MLAVLDDLAFTLRPGAQTSPPRGSPLKLPVRRCSIRDADFSYLQNFCFAFRARDVCAVGLCLDLGKDVE